MPWSRALRGDLDAIVDKALRKEAAERYPSVEALGEDLRRFLAGLPVAARRGARGYRLGKFLRRHRFGLIAATTIFVAAAAGVAGVVWQAKLAERERRKAVASERKAIAVNRFLVEELLGAASPEAARGRDLTVRQVLDVAARRVGSAFSEQPDLEQALRATLGEAFLELGDLEAAAEHLERSTALVGDSAATGGDSRQSNRISARSSSPRRRGAPWMPRRCSTRSSLGVRSRSSARQPSSWRWRAPGAARRASARVASGRRKAISEPPSPSSRSSARRPPGEHLSVLEMLAETLVASRKGQRGRSHRAPGGGACPSRARSGSSATGSSARQLVAGPARPRSSPRSRGRGAGGPGAGRTGARQGPSADPESDAGAGGATLGSSAVRRRATLWCNRSSKDSCARSASSTRTPRAPWSSWRSWRPGRVDGTRPKAGTRARSRSTAPAWARPTRRPFDRCATRTSSGGAGATRQGRATSLRSWSNRARGQRAAASRRRRRQRPRLVSAHRPTAGSARSRAGRSARRTRRRRDPARLAGRSRHSLRGRGAARPARQRHRPRDARRPSFRTVCSPTTLEERMAKLLEQQGEPEQVEEFLRRHLARRLAVHGADEVRSARTRQLLGAHLRESRPLRGGGDRSSARRWRHSSACARPRTGDGCSEPGRARRHPGRERASPGGGVAAAGGLAESRGTAGDRTFRPAGHRRRPGRALRQLGNVRRMPRSGSAAPTSSIATLRAADQGEVADQWLVLPVSKPSANRSDTGEPLVGAEVVEARTNPTTAGSS